MNDYGNEYDNPYESPEATAQFASQAGFPSYLAPFFKSTGWLKFTGIAMLVCSGLYSLVTIGIGLLVMWGPIWLGLLMVKMSSALESPTEGNMHKAFESLRMFFKVFGIYLIFNIALVILVFVIALIFPAMMMGMSGLPQ